VVVEELMRYHHAVVYAVGASEDRALGIPGEDLTNCRSAREFVAWYNGHPGAADLTFDLSHPRVVVIGNGNVALDVARILTMGPEALARTDIADHALSALRESAVEEVIVLGRRGPAEAAYTTPELLALANVEDIDLIVESPESSWSPQKAAIRRLKTEITFGLAGRAQSRQSPHLWINRGRGLRTR
jgi:ferredoxin--NADP+ reductase